MQINFRHFGLAIAAMLWVGGTVPAVAEDSAFLGSWMIDKAVVAPWANTVVKPDDAEMKSLLGKTITFKKESVVGPGVLACTGPTYKLTEGGADMLFQGALTQKPDGSEQDPAPSAAALGFHGSTIKTLQTGCENEIDYHFVDGDTVEFGLNDYVYSLKRQGN
ncbi:MAG TPA: hypothetical protein VND94_10375 [Terriglobia bacterium]|nr:hypothetical protein [Terriglobia bacterium]